MMRCNMTDRCNGKFDFTQGRGRKRDYRDCPHHGNHTPTTGAYNGRVGNCMGANQCPNRTQDAWCEYVKED